MVLSRSLKIPADLVKFSIGTKILVEVHPLNTAGEVGHLSISQRQGVITCIPKEDRSKSYLKNWRPISLLNVDKKKNRFICNCKPHKKFLRQINKFISKGFFEGTLHWRMH